MQTSYGFSGLLCFSKTNTNSHSCTSRHERKRGSAVNSCRLQAKLQSNTHFFMELDCCSREPKGKQKESYFSQFRVYWGDPD